MLAINEYLRKVKAPEGIVHRAMPDLHSLLSREYNEIVAMCSQYFIIFAV